MGIVNYAYEPEQSVFVITSDTASCPIAIMTGIVLRVRIEILAAEVNNLTTIEYDIQLTGLNGTNPFLETDVFADYDAAQTEYETRISAAT